MQTYQTLEACRLMCGLPASWHMSASSAGRRSRSRTRWAALAGARMLRVMHGACITYDAPDINDVQGLSYVIDSCCPLLHHASRQPGSVQARRAPRRSRPAGAWERGGRARAARDREPHHVQRQHQVPRAALPRVDRLCAARAGEALTLYLLATPCIPRRSTAVMESRNKER